MGENGNDRVLNFVAGGQGNELSALDGDLYSWMFMNSDLFPAGSHSQPNGAPSSSAEDIDMKAFIGTEMIGSPTGTGRTAAFPVESHNDLVPGVEVSQIDNIGIQSPISSLNRNGFVKKMSAAPDRKRSSMSMSVTSSDAGYGSANELANSSIDKNDPDREKKLERLKKNREIARNCRKRKRERMAQLEEEVVKLREWNRQLEMKLNKGKGGRDREDMRVQEMKSMKELLQSNTSENEMKQKMEAYAEMYSDFGRERKAAINFHLSKLKSLLLPNQVSKMTLWSLQQDDEFYDEKRNQKTFGGSIWNMLCEACRLTPEQKKQLIEMRAGIIKQRKNLGECLRILGELENRIGDNFGSLAEQMTTLMSITTPTQQARFLLWIEDNQACMHMLNNLWNQKGSELPGAPPKDGPNGSNAGESPSGSM